MTQAQERAQALLRQGHALEDTGQPAEARRCYEAAAALTPDSPLPWLNVGNAFQKEGRRPDAMAATLRAVMLAPTFAPAHFNLGLLQRSSDPAAAEQSLRRALALDSGFADAALALADLLEASGRQDEARAELRRAVDMAPGRAAPAYNLALSCIECDELDDAHALLVRAIAAEPGFAPAHAALGNVLVRSGRARDAEAHYRRSLALDPRAHGTAASLLFSLTARDDLAPAELFAAHLEVAGAMERALPPATALPPASAHRRLRIGYLSPDFRAHAVALFIRPVLEHHDRSTFEVFCYDSGHVDHVLTRTFRALAEHWRDIAALDDEQAAACIRRDELDILVDLAGFTAGTRVWLFPRRCAPVQATWLGYLHSTGLVSADIRICDASTDPPGMTESLHTERLVRLPHSLWCYAPMHQSTPPIRPPRARDHVVFGSFNQFWKISERSVRMWCALLAALPDARLRVVGVPRGSVRARFLERIAAQGVDTGRVTLSGRLDVDAYFRAMADVDIALDTLPYNGGTTTLDALWSGTPLVALAGDRSVSRSGASILGTVGLPDLVAVDEAQYQAINMRLAQDHPWRAQLCASLHDRLAASPLMDAPGFTRDIEALFRTICRRP